jgi:hypothetical protein
MKEGIQMAISFPLTTASRADAAVSNVEIRHRGHSAQSVVITTIVLRLVI